MLAAVGYFAGCSALQEREQVSIVIGGDQLRGRAAIKAYGCTTCHRIPGIPGADGLVGPSLEEVASRAYLAGRITNTPENMTYWIRFPRNVDPETVMPNLNVTEEEGRDITAYLYTLR